MFVSCSSDVFDALTPVLMALCDASAVLGPAGSGAG